MFHYPCVERLLSRGNQSIITCPMRCALRTAKEDILIASDRNKDDGSKIDKKIEGSWGTKLDRIISDVLSVIPVKSIIFSQWDDVLSILEKALQTNRINYVRPRGHKSFGDSIKIFRSIQYHVLLINLKHGAEGLTLVEAKHIFMYVSLFSV